MATKLRQEVSSNDKYLTGQIWRTCPTRSNGNKVTSTGKNVTNKMRCYLMNTVIQTQTCLTPGPIWYPQLGRLGKNAHPRLRGITYKPAKNLSSDYPEVGRRRRHMGQIGHLFTSTGKSNTEGWTETERTWKRGYTRPAGQLRNHEN